MQKITTFLWFDSNAGEAVEFYTSVFQNSRILSKNSVGGKLISASFELEGQEFIALNGGPQFKFTEAISLFVKCSTQEEIDEKWERLTADGGKESMCGWLKDKYGLSWQIIPPVLMQYLGHKDPEKAKRAMEAMMKMKKIEIKKLEEAVS